MAHLIVPYFKQDNDYSCGPASLQMVFAYYHKRISEANLTRELRTKEATGTTPSWMIRIARKYGFFCYVNNDSSLEELRYFVRLKKPVIVYFVEPVTNDDHFAVVVDVSIEEVILNDPVNGKKFVMRKDTFDRRWHGEKKYQKSLRRWMVVVSPEEISVGRQYKPMAGIFRNLV